MATTNLLPAPPTDPSDSDLLARVHPDPQRPGPDRWRVLDGDLAVWALIQHLAAIGDLADPLLATEELIARTAADHRIPEVGVRAALAYYRAHRCPIDTRLAINAAVASGK